MRNKSIVIASLLAIVAVQARAAEPASPAAHSARQLAIEAEATELIDQVQETAHELRFHAVRLERLTDTVGASRWTHYHHLDEVKALVNESVRPALKRLNEIQRELPEWKQESVDRMIASAQQLAADTSSAFATKAANPAKPPVLNEEYKQFVRDVAMHTADLLTTADAAHDFAVAHRKAVTAGLPVSKQ
jgi:hypothetical protein